MAAARSAERTHSGFVRFEFLIAAWMTCDSAAENLAPITTPLASPFGSFGLPIFFFILSVNNLFDSILVFVNTMSSQ